MKNTYINLKEKIKRAALAERLAKIKGFALAAIVAIGLGCLCSGCSSLWLGATTDIPMPGGDISISAGTTIPLNQPYDYGWPGPPVRYHPVWHPGPGPMAGPVFY